MKIKISQEELSNRLDIISHAISQKTTMPILECVLLTFKDGMLSCFGTNLDISIRTSVPCEGKEEGRIATKVKVLFDLVKKLPKGWVDIRSTEKELVLKAGEVNLKLSLIDPAQYPQLPEFNPKASFAIPQNTLKSMITQTRFARAEDGKNDVFSGEYLEVRKNKLRMTALDFRRIAIREEEITSEDTYSAIIPGKTIEYIGRILSDKKEDAVVSFSSNMARFEIDDTLLISRLVDGKFPALGSILQVQNQCNTKLCIKREELYCCLDRAMLLRNSNALLPVVFRCEPSKERLNISVQSSEGVLDETLLVTGEGQNILVAFDPRIYLDMLKVYPEDITLEFWKNDSPCFIQSKGFIYVVMPCKIN